MFGQNGDMKTTVAERASWAKRGVAHAADALAEYLDPLARDEKLRRRLAAAIVAGIAARRRVSQQTGLTGLARRLGSDAVLRGQLIELGTQLQAAQKRAKKARSHKLRNTVLFLSGVGLAIAALPAAREKLVSAVGARRDNPTFGSWSASTPKQTPVEQEVEHGAIKAETTAEGSETI
jgi:hypothetical protein